MNQIGSGLTYDAGLYCHKVTDVAETDIAETDMVDADSIAFITRSCCNLYVDGVGHFLHTNVVVGWLCNLIAIKAFRYRFPCLFFITNVTG